MTNYINCTAHHASDGNLLVGEAHTAMIDCGMAFCADETIKKVKTALNDRPLDYIFFSHTHYDHIGALPFFKKEWPQARVVTSAPGAAVLLKDTPRRVIREMSIIAAKANGSTLDTPYSDDVFHADIIVEEGSAIDLGGLSVQVIETPGHTRDSLSFLMPELEILALSETLGVLMPDGSVHPCYLTSFADTISAIKKCSQLPHKHLSLPHQGLISSEKANGFFEKALAANIACWDFIIGMKQQGLDEEEMLTLFFQKYGSDVLFSYQPREAFMLNSRATISCTLQGYLQNSRYNQEG